MDRTRTTKFKKGERPNADFVSGPPEELLDMMWEMTVEAYSLADPDFDPDEPMKRHVTKLIRHKEDE